MKPASFRYHRVATTDDALALLRECGDDAKCLAGGQSLVPLMNMRLALPTDIIDINECSELSYLREDDGSLLLGAMTRQRSVELSELMKRKCPLMAVAIQHVGHVSIRNRGTVGGSIAHADPASEIPTVMMCLAGEVSIQGQSGVRCLRAEDFITGPFMTALAPDELLLQLRVPQMEPSDGWAFVEFSRRRGDFAIAAVAVLLRRVENTVERLSLAVAGAGPRPVRCVDAEQYIIGADLSSGSIEAAASRAANEVELVADEYGDVEYKRSLVRTLVKRAVAEAGNRPTS